MVAMRRVDATAIALALADSVKVTAMLMLIVIASRIFGRFLSYSQIPHALLDLLGPVMHQPTLVVAILLGVFFVFGCFWSLQP